MNHAVTLIGWSDSKRAWLIKKLLGKWLGRTCGFWYSERIHVDILS